MNKLPAINQKKSANEFPNVVRQQRVAPIIHSFHTLPPCHAAGVCTITISPVAMAKYALAAATHRATYVPSAMLHEQQGRQRESKRSRTYDHQSHCQWLDGGQPTNQSPKQIQDRRRKRPATIRKKQHNCPLQYQNNSSSSVDSAAAKSRHHFCCTLMCSRRAAQAAQTCSKNLLSPVQLNLNIRVHSCGHERLQQQQHS
ncbi:unnamed protein product [Ceratitis capitata]|uniref:(Mediterranean fruit fly) hypothetical protein n=1 Tax=Ceratitis capitata TaxID=7213 RepID=A0A811UJU8_CERCA|nr:unnamed protein product [Ceratitis capitata]